MVWTPLPESLITMVKRVFSGSALDIAWKLGLIVGGVILVLFLAEVGGFLVLTILGMLIAAAWSDNVRRIYADIWHRRFFKL